MALPSIGPAEAYPAFAAGSFETVEELVNTYEEGAIVDVPLELIDREEVPVDEEHVAELAASMEEEAQRHGGTGQLAALNLAQVPGREKLAIIDGFHRDGGLYSLGRSTGKATIRLNTSEEELADLRVLAANMHKSVSFARQVAWVEQVWIATPWASEDLTAAKAFALASGKLASSRYDLTPEQIAAITEWVTNKSQKWGVAISTMHNNLLVAQAAAPQLVAEARGRVSGRNLEALTPQHLGVIARGLPYDYPFQLLAAGVAKQHALTVPQTRTLVKKISPTHNIEEAQRLVASIDWRYAGSTYSPSRERERRSISRQQPIAQSEAHLPPPESGTGLGLAHKFVLSELTIARLSLESLVLRGQYVPPVVGSSVHAGWKLERADDPDISELTKPYDRAAGKEAFFNVIDIDSDRLLDSLQKRHHLSEADANRVLCATSSRVVADIENGDLSFASHILSRATTVRELIVNCLRDELERRQSVAAKEPLRLPLEAVTASLPNVVQAIPYMPDQVRRAVIMNGLLDLSVGVAASITGWRPAIIPGLLRSGAEVVAAVVDQKERQQSRELHHTVPSKGSNITLLRSPGN